MIVCSEVLQTIRRWAGVFVMIPLLFCSSSIEQFYPDHFHSEDNIYENKPLKFLLTFTGNWRIYTDPNKMDPDSKAFAKTLSKSGLELLFVGTTVEGLHGTRGIAVNLNEPARQYAEYVRRLNKDDVENDQGLTDFYAGTYPMVKWVYDKAGFRFVEFFFNIETYDIRIAFWTRTHLFGNFLPVFESIISSLIITRFSL